MMDWLLFLLCATGLTALTGIFFRVNPWHFSAWKLVLVLLPVTLWMQFCFARAFGEAPRFFIAWFIGTAFCAAIALIATHFLFHEKFTLTDLFGLVMVLCGAAILATG